MPNPPAPTIDPELALRMIDATRRVAQAAGALRQRPRILYSGSVTLDGNGIWTSAFQGRSCGLEIELPPGPVTEIVTVPNPAAATPWSYTLPTPARVLSVQFKAVNGQTGPATPYLFVKDPDGNMIGEMTASASIAAGVSGYAMWAIGGPQTSTNSYEQNPLPDYGILPAGATLSNLGLYLTVTNVVIALQTSTPILTAVTGGPRSDHAPSSGPGVWPLTPGPSPARIRVPADTDAWTLYGTPAAVVPVVVWGA